MTVVGPSGRPIQNFVQQLKLIAGASIPSPLLITFFLSPFIRLEQGFSYTSYPGVRSVVWLLRGYGSSAPKQSRIGQPRLQISRVSNSWA